MSSYITAAAQQLLCIFGLLKCLSEAPHLYSCLSLCAIVGLGLNYAGTRAYGVISLSVSVSE